MIATPSWSVIATLSLTALALAGSALAANGPARSGGVLEGSSSPATALVQEPLNAPESGSQDDADEPPVGPDAVEADGDARMRAVLAEIAAAAELDRYVGAGELPALEAELAEIGDDDRLRRRLELLRQIGFHRLRLGRTAEATEAYAKALEVALALGDKLDPAEAEAQADDVRFELAVAWLRHGETQNCVARHTAQSCLLPIGPAGVHVDQEGSRRALELLVELLPKRPRDASAAWLANLAAMTLGTWPDDVPPDWRAPASSFESKVDFPRFPEVAAERGLASFDMSGGSLVDDLDGDGVLDVMTSSWGPRNGLRFFRGLGQGRFEERSDEAGLAGINGGLNLVQADYDDDGDVDVLVLRGAWLMRDGRLPNSLLRNEGGRFVDVSFEAGLGKPWYPTQAAAFADYDNDGDLDFFVGNEQSERLRAPCQMFRNQGDGTFVDVAPELGLTVNAFTKGVAWGDYDGDRWPDLYVSNMGQENRLFRNRDGSFKDVARKLKVLTPMTSFATGFLDYDDDGRLDLYVASYRPVLGGVAASLLGWESQGEGPELYRQDESGGFVPTGAIVRPACVMGTNFGDLDGDGRLDLYLGTGYPAFEALMPNLMYLNDGRGGFVDVTAAGGFGHLQKGHGVSFADIDGDGDVDVHEQMGGAFPGDAFGNALYLNPGFGNAWLDVRLRGVQSNHFGIGARIRCRISEDGRERLIHRWVGSGASFGANPITRTLVGLGKAELVDELEIWWPTSDTTQVFREVPVNGAVLVVEGEDQLRAP